MHITRRDVSALGNEDAQRLVTALQLRQLELEVQNESLRNALQQCERELRGDSELFDSVPVGCVRLGASGEVQRANAAALRAFVTPREGLIGRRLSAFIASDERWLFDELLAEARQYTSAAAELTIVPLEAARTKLQLEIRALSGSNLEYLVMLIEPKEAQTASLRASWTDLAERFESLGQLAAGIAHDFNNLLVGVLGNAELLSLMPGVSAEWSERLSLIVHAGRQGSELTRQLLMVAARSKMNASTLSMQALIEEHLQQRRAGLLPSIELHAQICSQLAPIFGDGEQIGLVLKSLMDNAVEALDGRGAIVVQARAQKLNAEELESFHHRSAALPGKFVVVEVRDSGPGIDVEVLSSMFDPYFSTKPGHRGLGLSLVLGIVQNHHGAVRVHTRLGGGTCFEIALPASALQLEAASDGAGTQRASLGDVLLIDDDDAVRKVVACLLGVAGFEVTQADRGDVGLELYRTGRSRFKLVVLDWIMPGVSGKQVLEELRAVDPQLPVIVVSGYGAEHFDDHDDRLLRLAKPMTFYQMCDAIERLTGMAGLSERANA